MPALPHVLGAVDERKLPQYVGQRDVAKMLGKCVRTLQRIRNDDPSFPTPVLNGKQQKAWRIADILAWDDARHAAGQQELVASAVASPDAVSDDRLPDALEALATRFLGLHGEQLVPGDVLSVGVQRPLTNEQLSAIAHNADAKQRELIEGILTRLDGLHMVEAMMLQRAFLPPLRRFADEGLKQLGIDITMTDTEWHEAGMLIVDRVINGETLAPNTHPREVIETLAEDGVLARRPR